MAGPDASRRLGRPRRLGGVDELRPARASPISNPIQPIQSNPVLSNPTTPIQPTSQPTNQSNPIQPIQSKQTNLANPIQSNQSNPTNPTFCGVGRLKHVCSFFVFAPARPKHPPRQALPARPPRPANTPVCAQARLAPRQPPASGGAPRRRGH